MKTNSKKLLVCAILAAILSVPMISIVNAAPTDDLSPPPLLQDNPADNGEPVLIAPYEDTTTSPSDNPVLIQTRDNSTIAPNGNSQSPLDHESGSDDSQTLTSTLTQSNNASLIVVGVALVAMAAVCAAIAVSFSKMRKK